MTVCAPGVNSMDWETLLPEERIEEVFTPQEEEGGPPEKAKDTGAVQLYKLAKDQGVVTFRAESGAGIFVRYPNNGRHEIAPLASERFRSWLVMRYFMAVGREARTTEQTGVLSLLQAEAWNEPPKKLHVRLAGASGKVYLDLADEGHRAVVIDRNGWTVTSSYDVWFLRSPAMLPLPEPEPGGSLADLKPFINCEEEDLAMITAWLVASMNPAGPFPVLAVSAEQGSGKSTLTTLLKQIIDPDSAPRLGMFKGADDLFATAASRWVLAYDNIGRLTEEDSNHLCRLATGGGLSKRQLYSDNEAVSISAMRPVILNGISLTIGRMDLLDRSYPVRLLPIKTRMLESEYYCRLDELRPRLLGALCTAVSSALREEDYTPEGLSRMADAGAFVLRAERGGGLPWGRGYFAKVLRSREEGKLEEAMADDSVAQKILTLADCGGWTGSMRGLLASILESVEPEERKFLPSTPRGLGRRLDEIAPLLRSAGVRMEKRRTKYGWMVTLGMYPQEGGVPAG